MFIASMVISSPRFSDTPFNLAEGEAMSFIATVRNAAPIAAKKSEDKKLVFKINIAATSSGAVWIIFIMPFVT